MRPGVNVLGRGGQVVVPDGVELLGAGSDVVCICGSAILHERALPVAGAEHDPLPIEVQRVSLRQDLTGTNPRGRSRQRLTFHANSSFEAAKHTLVLKKRPMSMESCSVFLNM